jgi:Mg2+ and Co2+ transporter CorA
VIEDQDVRQRNSSLRIVQRVPRSGPLGSPNLRAGVARPCCGVAAPGASQLEACHWIAEREKAQPLAVDVFVGPNYVLSVRNKSKLGFLGVRERCERDYGTK